MFTEQIYENIYNQLVLKKDEQYPFISTTSTQKQCVLNADVPDSLHKFSYGAILNSAKNITNDHIVIWDVFNTGQFYVSQNVYNQVGYLKGTVPIFYIYNLGIKDSHIFNPNNNNSSENNPISQSIANKSFVHYRYNDENYNGWAFSWYGFFGVAPLFDEEDESQPQLSFETNFETSTLNEVLKNVTTMMEQENIKISKMISKTKISKQAKNLLNEIKEAESLKNTVTPICSNYTCVSESTSVNIVSKDYVFANSPEGFSYCSHKDAVKSFNGTVALCPFSLTHHSVCPMYNPCSEVIERRNSLDHSGNLLYDFEIRLSSLNNLNNVVVIENMINNQIVSTITYPINTTSQEAVAKARVLLDDLI